MIVVFAGPSLFGAAVDRAGIDFRGPARQGDVARAALEGATTIGLIDGVFGSAAAVWHKEILYALSRDVRVLGAASMGALRAAECATYGMEPIGRIAAKYVSGELDDDAAVALTFGPPELDFCPLTEPLVDIDDKVEQLLENDAISHPEAGRIASAAREIYYADRTMEAVLSLAFPHAGDRSSIVLEAIAGLPSSLKQRDAVELISTVRGTPAPAHRRNWRLTEPRYWRDTIERLTDEVADRVTVLSRHL